MSERPAEMLCVTGTNGTGKSTIVKKIFQAAINRGERAIIFTPDETEWPSIPQVHPVHTHHIEIYKGARKMVVFDDDFPERVELLINHFRRGIIVFDDMMAYNKHSTHPILKRLLIRRRQMEADIVAVGHSFTEIPPRFYPFFSRFVMFMATNDVGDRRKSLGKPLAKILEEKQNEINRKAIDNLHYKEIWSRQQLEKQMANG